MSGRVPVDPELITPLLEALQWLPSPLRTKAHPQPLYPVPANLLTFILTLTHWVSDTIASPHPRPQTWKYNPTCSPLGASVLPVPLPGMHSHLHLHKTGSFPHNRLASEGGASAQRPPLMSQCGVTQRPLSITWPSSVSSSHLALGRELAGLPSECCFLLPPSPERRLHKGRDLAHVKSSILF